MNRIVSFGLVAMTASFAIGSAACAGSAVGGTEPVESEDAGSQHPTQSSDAGADSSPYAPPPGRDSGPSATCAFSSSDSTCEACIETNCTQACASCSGDTECDNATSCAINCGSDTACADACLENLSSTSMSLFNAFLGSSGCVDTDCSAACGGGSSLPLGAACTAASQCVSGECANGGSGTGWCTETCTSNAQCPNAPYVMWCVENSSNYDTCFTACSTASDCSGYGASAYCETVTTIDGFVTGVCVD